MKDAPDQVDDGVVANTTRKHNAVEWSRRMGFSQGPATGLLNGIGIRKVKVDLQSNLPSLEMVGRYILGSMDEGQGKSFWKCVREGHVAVSMFGAGS